MTIFQHTIDKVVSGSKVQTSRIWKDDYVFSWSDYEEPNQIVLSQKAWDAGKIRKLYYVGQTLSVQPSRGAKGVAKIRITGLAKRDVRDFTAEDIRREGFLPTKSGFVDFYRVWYGMHFPAYVKLLDDNYVNADWWLDSMKAQIAKHNTALVIRFELVESVAA